MGTRVLNFDNVRQSGELHDNVKELYNVLLLFHFDVKTTTTNLGSCSSLLNLSLLILGL